MNNKKDKLCFDILNINYEKCISNINNCYIGTVTNFLEQCSSGVIESGFIINNKDDIPKKCNKMLNECKNNTTNMYFNCLKNNKKIIKK